MTDHRKHITLPHGAIINSDRLISKTNGDTDNPAISFKAEPLKGFFINNNSNLVHTTAIRDTIEFMSNSTKFLTPIAISEIPDNDLNMIEVKPELGILFKKSGDNSLWWRTVDGDIKLGVENYQSKNTTYDDTLLKEHIQATEQQISAQSHLNEQTTTQIKEQLNEQMKEHIQATEQQISAQSQTTAQMKEQLKEHIQATEQQISAQSQTTAQLKEQLKEHIHSTEQQISAQSHLNEQTTAQMNEHIQATEQQILAQSQTTAQMKEQLKEQLKEHIQATEQQISAQSQTTAQLKEQLNEQMKEHIHSTEQQISAQSQTTAQLKEQLKEQKELLSNQNNPKEQILLKDINYLNDLDTLDDSNDLSKSYGKSYGKLYKKPGSDGLWWKTLTVDVNLAKTPEPPKQQPNYFNNDGSVLTMGGNKISVVNKELHINDNPIYNQNIKFISSMDIAEGDLICMDLTENERVVKGLGGKIELTGIKEEHPISYADVYDYNDSSFILAYTTKTATSISITILLVDKYDYNITKKYSDTFLCSDDVLNYITQISNDNYTLAYCSKRSCLIKMISISNVFTTPFVDAHDIILTSKCDSMCVKYDSHYIVVYYNELSQEFRSIILDNYFNVNINDQRLCNVYIQNISNIQLLNIPGGTWIISMGYVKFAMLVSAGYLRCGDNAIDYNSVECIDMIYDQNHSVIMSMEKTISESFYVQTWDISGLNLQKLSNISFGNVNIRPLSINTNNNNYVAMYSIENKIYIQLFEYDGRALMIGLRYSCDISGIEKSQIFALRGTNKFIFYANELVSFIANFQGVPAGFIGVATEDAREGDSCSVTVKGHIYYNKINMPENWVGKKLYITETNKPYPYYMSISPLNGVFLGTCISRNKIILGL